MKISIITTTYNMENYIEETIESVLSQRGDFELEYIIIDAKSTDATLDKINKYKSFVDNGFYSNRNKGINMQVISEQDNGLYDGISKGFALATGDIVAYINADDFYFPNAFSCVCQVFEKYKNIKWLMGRTVQYNQLGHNIFNFLPPNFDKELFQKGAYGKKLPFIQQESCFWKKELLDKVNMEEFKKFKYAGDFYLWNTFFDYEQLYILNSCLAGFRYREDQKSSDKEAYFKEVDFIIKDYKLNKNDLSKIKIENSCCLLSDEHKIIQNNTISYCQKEGSWQLSPNKTVSKKNLLNSNLRSLLKEFNKNENNIFVKILFLICTKIVKIK